MKEPAIVLYHAGCWDGFCAAWVAARTLGPDTECVAVHYGQPFPKLDYADRKVYILDFSYPLDELRTWAAGKRPLFVCILDHHKTAEQDLKPIIGQDQILPSVLSFVAFDMHKSGARMTWEYFNGVQEHAIPWLVKYTEDRDLWKHQLPFTKEVNACLRSHPFDLKLWDSFKENYTNPEGNPHHLFITEGSAILRAEQAIIDSHVRNAVEINFAGYKIRCVNATVLHSSIGNDLAIGYPFALTYFINQGGEYVCSLRSNEKGIDISKIAKQLGGGGHRNAAGFKSGNLPFLIANFKYEENETTETQTLPT